jgi:hypothetical protein
MANKKVGLNPWSEANVWEKEKRATLFLKMEIPEEKPVPFKVKIEKMVCTSMVGRVADMLETAIGWYGISGFSQLQEKREELAAKSKDYLLKDFPEEKDIMIEIYDIVPNKK